MKGRITQWDSFAFIPWFHRNLILTVFILSSRMMWEHNIKYPSVNRNNIHCLFPNKDWQFQGVLLCGWYSPTDSRCPFCLIWNQIADLKNPSDFWRFKKARTLLQSKFGLDRRLFARWNEIELSGVKVLDNKVGGRLDHNLPKEIIAAHVIIRVPPLVSTREDNRLPPPGSADGFATGIPGEGFISNLAAHGTFGLVGSNNDTFVLGVDHKAIETPSKKDSRGKCRFLSTQTRGVCWNSWAAIFESLLGAFAFFLWGGSGTCLGQIQLQPRVKSAQTESGTQFRGGEIEILAQQHPFKSWNGSGNTGKDARQAKEALVLYEPGEDEEGSGACCMSCWDSKDPLWNQQLSLISWLDVTPGWNSKDSRKYFRVFS